MSAIADTTFKITNTKFHVTIVTLSSKDNVKLVKLLQEGFKRPAYWNEYQTKIETRNLDNNDFTRFLLDTSFQGVRRLFVLVFNNVTFNYAVTVAINNTILTIMQLTILPIELKKIVTQNILFQE